MNSSPERNPPQLREISIYNPDQLDKKELIAYFVVRGPLLGRILADLRQGKSAQHHLVIGMRGMGKTTLLKRIAYAIDDDPDLEQQWLSLTFPEEQYNVNGLADLYINCIDAMSDALEKRGEQQRARKLDAEVAAISATSETERCRRALGILLEAAADIGKRLVLLLDNVDKLLDQLTTKKQSWALRELLSRKTGLTLIGASLTSPTETVEYSAPFYEFFKVHNLRGLPEDEARRLILHLANMRNIEHVRRMVETEPARLRTLHTLSGGNPRTLVQLYYVLVHSTDGDAQDDLYRLLDQLTPLYQTRMDELATQQQKIFDAIALHWHPATAAEIASRTHLDVGVVSSQINRLLEKGILERAQTPTSSKMSYQVAERLFNIWYLMRQSRRVRQKLVWFVDFLRMFYGSQELVARARSNLGRHAPTDDRDRMQYVETQFALADAVDDVHLRRALENSGIRAMVESPALRAQISRIVDLDGADASFRSRVDKRIAAAELQETILAAKVSIDHWNARAFADLLGSSLSLSRYEKRRIAEKLGQLRPSELQTLETDFKQEVEYHYWNARNVEDVELLRRAFREGIMDDLADVDGAIDAAHLYAAPNLPVIAKLARAKRTADEQHLLASLETRPNASVASNWVEYGDFVQRHLLRYADAEDAYRHAIALDTNYAAAWHRLGRLLLAHLSRYAEAEQTLRRATEIDPSVGVFWKDLAWCRFLTRQVDDHTETYARQAKLLDPHNVHVLLTLACILVRRGKWDEPADLLTAITSIATGVALEQTWSYIIHFFAVCVQMKRTTNAIDLLDKIGFGDRWLPLRTALVATIEGETALFRIAPELRAPAAEQIFAQLQTQSKSLTAT